MNFKFPKNWNDLEQIVNTGVLDTLPVEYKRSSEVTQRYQTDRNLVSKEEALGKIYAEINAALTTLPGGEEVALTENKYPYDLLLQNLPGVTHALLWFKGSLSTEQAKSYVQSQGKKCCLYENPVALKSIPEINHYQIFLLDNMVSLSLPEAA